MTKLDVLSIGDVVTDAFIKLLDDRAEAYQDERGKWLSIPFATKVPFDHAVEVDGVGNAANASVSFAKMGLRSGLISNVGDDQHGRDIISTLKKLNVDTRFIHVNPGKISNFHYVLWYKEERTILIKHEEYEYQWPSFREEDIPKWIYFSSISKDALDTYHDFVTEWLGKHPNIRFAFQPGTFQLEAGVERLSALYKRADVLLVNREEAVLISGGNYDDLNNLFDRLHAYGPQVVVITDGPAGAYASELNNARFKMPPYPDPAPPYERTGAGDAFSSAFVAELIKGNTVEGALQIAPINSMSVVQHVGAREGLLTEAEIEELLKKAPHWYKPERT